MKLYKSTTICDDDYEILINGEKIQIIHNGVSHLYDFSELENGYLINTDKYIQSCERINGELKVRVLEMIKDLKSYTHHDGWLTPTVDDELKSDYISQKIVWKNQEEIEMEKLFENLKPDVENVDNASFEIKIINLLMELEVI